MKSAVVSDIRYKGRANTFQKTFLFQSYCLVVTINPVRLNGMYYENKISLLLICTVERSIAKLMKKTTFQLNKIPNCKSNASIVTSKRFLINHPFDF